MKAIRVWSVLFMIFNSMLLLPAGFVVFEELDRGIRHPELFLFAFVPALLAIAANIYFGYCLAMPAPRPSEYMQIPLPNPEMDSWRRNVRGLGVVNYIYATTQLGFVGLFIYAAYETSRWDMAESMIFIVIAILCLGYCAGHFIHTAVVMKRTRHPL